MSVIKKKTNLSTKWVCNFIDSNKELNKSNVSLLLQGKPVGLVIDDNQVVIIPVCWYCSYVFDIGYRGVCICSNCKNNKPNRVDKSMMI
jgi:hypothetical protein